MEDIIKSNYIWSTSLGAAAALSPFISLGYLAYSGIAKETIFPALSPLMLLGVYGGAAAYSSKGFFNQAKYSYNTTVDIVSFGLKASAPFIGCTKFQSADSWGWGFVNFVCWNAGLVSSGLVYEHVMKKSVSSVINDIYYANHLDEAKIDTMGDYESGYYIKNPLYV